MPGSGAARRIRGGSGWLRAVAGQSRHWRNLIFPEDRAGSEAGSSLEELLRILGAFRRDEDNNNGFARSAGTAGAFMEHEFGHGIRRAGAWTHINSAASERLAERREFARCAEVGDILRRQ